MTPRQVELVQTSWALVEPISETAARLFYRRLFEVAPEVRPLLKTSISERGDRLLETIGSAVDGLDSCGSMPSVGASLGLQDDYATEPEHAAIVGETLLWTLRQALGEAFRDEARLAWAEMYASLPGAAIRASALGLEQPELASA